MGEARKLVGGTVVLGVHVAKSLYGRWRRMSMVETAAPDSDVSDLEVRELRDDLARELERLASADIKASRGPEVRQDSR